MSDNYLCSLLGAMQIALSRKSKIRNLLEVALKHDMSIRTHCAIMFKSVADCALAKLHMLLFRF
jgi:hypothetical protein